jgi:hypothetical protein
MRSALHRTFTTKITYYVPYLEFGVNFGVLARCLFKLTLRLQPFVHEVSRLRRGRNRAYRVSRGTRLQWSEGMAVSVFDQEVMTWRKSLFCNNGECVEVASWRGQVLIRNSGDSAVVLNVHRSTWQKFIAHVRVSASPEGGTARLPSKAESSCRET